MHSSNQPHWACSTVLRYGSSQFSAEPRFTPGFSFEAVHPDSHSMQVKLSQSRFASWSEHTSSRGMTIPALTMATCKVFESGGDLSTGVVPPNRLFILRRSNYAFGHMQPTGGTSSTNYGRSSYTFCALPEHALYAPRLFRNRIPRWCLP